MIKSGPWDPLLTIIYIGKDYYYHFLPYNYSSQIHQNEFQFGIELPWPKAFQYFSYEVPRPSGGCGVGPFRTKTSKISNLFSVLCTICFTSLMLILVKWEVSGHVSIVYWKSMVFICEFWIYCWSILIHIATCMYCFFAQSNYTL